MLGFLTHDLRTIAHDLHEPAQFGEKLRVPGPSGTLVLFPFVRAAYYWINESSYLHTGRSHYPYAEQQQAPAELQY